MPKCMNGSKKRKIYRQMAEAIKSVEKTERRKDKRQKQNRQMAKEHQALEALRDSLGDASE